MVFAIVVGVIVGWFAVALAVALFIGRAAALGEHHHRGMTATRFLPGSTRFDSTSLAVELLV